MTWGDSRDQITTTTKRVNLFHYNLRQELWRNEQSEHGWERSLETLRRRKHVSPAVQKDQHGGQEEGFFRKKDSRYKAWR